MGLVGNILLSSIILILISEKVRAKLSSWFSVSAWRIFAIPATLLAINAVLLSLAGAWNLESFLRLSVYFLIPTIVVALFARKVTHSSWQANLHDLAVLMLLWLPVAFKLIQKNWKFSEFNYSLTALSAVIFAIVVYTCVRKLDFSMAWQIRWQDFKKVIWAYLILLAPMVTITLIIGFTKINLSKKFDWNSLILAPQLLIFFVGLWFAPALVEEIIFRGVIQNTLVDRLKPVAGILLASVIFGISHIGNREGGYRFPNWPYVALASVAGLAYGLVFHLCKKKGSRNALAMAATLHAAVDFTWFVFLRNR